VEERKRKGLGSTSLSIPARIAILLAVGLGIATLVVHTSDLRPPWLTSNDFTSDYLSARVWLDGGEPYAPLPQLIDRYLGKGTPYFDISPPDQVNAHPPIIVLITSPLALLPYKAARTLWFVLVAGLTVIATWLIARGLKLERSIAAALSLGVLALPVSQMNFQIGQWNAFMFIPLVCAWLSMKRGHDALAGTLLGLATALRFFPAFLMIPLLRERRYRAFVWQALVAFGASAIGVLFIGLHSTHVFASSVGRDTAFWRAHPGNVSLLGDVYRWFQPSIWRPDAFHLSWLALILAILAVGLCVAGAATTPSRTAGDLYWQSVPWMLLAAPLSWQSYEVLVFPLLLVAVERARRAGSMPPLTLLLGTALVVGSTPRGIATSIGGHISNLRWLALSSSTIGLLLMAASGWLPPRRVNEARAQAPQRPDVAAPL